MENTSCVAFWVGHLQGQRHRDEYINTQEVLLSAISLLQGTKRYRLCAAENPPNPPDNYPSKISSGWLVPEIEAG